MATSRKSAKTNRGNMRSSQRSGVRPGESRSHTEPAPGSRQAGAGRRSIRAAVSKPSKPLNLSRLELHSVRDRKHISQIDAFAGTPEAGCGFAEWAASLPSFLGVKKLRAVVEAIVAARRGEKPVAFAMGGHVVKVGCGPIVIDLMRRGIVTAVACHGATAIHDMEIAMLGATSEDVGDTIRDGRFGMVRETMEFFAGAAKLAARKRMGLGRAVGQLILDRKFPLARYSVLAVAAELDLPATVHVAIGTDTVHMSPKIDGAALGAATLQDFRTLCSVVSAMGTSTGGKARGGAGRAATRSAGGSSIEGVGGVWCNVGSAVLMPEVFLKAVSVARNLGSNLDHLTTVNFDMLRHYRPAQNVVSRPVSPGHGHDIAGHHEILLPLLRQAVIERLQHA